MVKYKNGFEVKRIKAYNEPCIEITTPDGEIFRINRNLGDTTYKSSIILPGAGRDKDGKPYDMIVFQMNDREYQIPLGNGELKIRFDTGKLEQILDNKKSK